jgi:regulator of RNase E activity RraA
MTEPDAEVIAKLKRSSSATISTMLFKRGLRNVAMRGARRVSRAGGVMVGEAFTLRSIPAREDIDQVDILQSSEHPQRKAFETCPAGRVLVADCRGETYAAFGGGILLARLAARGAAGMVSDGVVRDTAEVSAMALPVFCAGAAAPLSLARHHAVDIGVPIGCGGVAVYPGDIIVGDADGVVVVPRHLAAEIADAALEQERYDRFALEEIQAGRSLFGTYPPSDESRQRYATWLKNKPD